MDSDADQSPLEARTPPILETPAAKKVVWRYAEQPRAECLLPAVFTRASLDLSPVAHELIIAHRSKTTARDVSLMTPRNLSAELCALTSDWGTTLFQPKGLSDLRDANRGAVVEVGCNVRCQSQRLRNRTGRLFVGVEPVPKYARKTMLNSDLSVLWQTAIARDAAAVTLQTASVMTSMLNSTLAHAKSQAPVRVAAIPLELVLNTSVPQPLRIEILSVDAQGLDLQVVLSGGVQLKRVDNIILECQHLPPIDVQWLYHNAPNCSTIADALRLHGFRLSACYYNAGPQEYNCHFVPVVSHPGAYVFGDEDKAMLCQSRACLWNLSSLDTLPQIRHDDAHAEMPDEQRDFMDATLTEYIACWNHYFTASVRAAATEEQAARIVPSTLKHHCTREALLYRAATRFRMLPADRRAREICAVWRRAASRRKALRLSWREAVGGNDAVSTQSLSPIDCSYARPGGIPLPPEVQTCFAAKRHLVAVGDEQVQQLAAAAMGLPSADDMFDGRRAVSANTTWTYLSVAALSRADVPRVAAQSPDAILLSHGIHGLFTADEHPRALFDKTVMALYAFANASLGAQLFLIVPWVPEWTHGPRTKESACLAPDRISGVRNALSCAVAAVNSRLPVSQQVIPLDLRFAHTSPIVATHGRSFEGNSAASLLRIAAERGLCRNASASDVVVEAEAGKVGSAPLCNSFDARMGAGNASAPTIAWRPQRFCGCGAGIVSDQCPAVDAFLAGADDEMGSRQVRKRLAEFYCNAWVHRRSRRTAGTTSIRMDRVTPAQLSDIVVTIAAEALPVVRRCLANLGYTNGMNGTVRGRVGGSAATCLCGAEFSRRDPWRKPKLREFEFWCLGRTLELPSFLRRGFLRRCAGL